MRATVHAWPETTAYMWNLESTIDVMPSDDALEAEWFDEKNLPKNIHPSHAKIIELALSLSPEEIAIIKNA